MAYDLNSLRLWSALKGATDSQRATVQQLVDFAAPLLDRVIETFPTYTLHDTTHARNVAELMADLLGTRLADPTPLEGALLILSAFFHDIGMLSAHDDLINVIAEPEWDDFLTTHPEAFLTVANAADQKPPLATVEQYCR